MAKKIALLGATGSIGTSTIEVLREHPTDFEILIATAHKDYQKLFTLAQEFHIPYLVLTGISKDEVRHIPSGTMVYFGEAELVQLLKNQDYDIALNAITGSAGLRSTIAVLERGIDLALANKESLVMAGHLVQKLLDRGSRILPVDSEHSAIFQAIGSHPQSEIRCIHITASGGPFRNLPLEDFDRITIQQALKHPNWSMGTKVTLDSATMFNKALEVIEAHWLFGVPYQQIKAIIHPQSIIHSLVEFIDGSFLAQLSEPDMRLPILYALSYPQRLKSGLVQTDLLKLSPLSFEEIEPRRYPLFYLGVEAGIAGGILPTVMNAANEAALRLFLDGKIGFKGIYEWVERAVSSHPNLAEPDLECIIQTNLRVYESVLSLRIL
jgi:1-deoxy-D-xylulose-5-phosphate reductoisomerase